MRIHTLVISVLLLQAPLTLRAQRPDTLPAAVRALLEQPAVQRAHWGIAVRDAASGAELFGHNAHKLFIPASNQKLVVAAAAAHYLDPGFRYTTTLESAGDIVDGALLGDLILRGTGDPAISARYHPDMLSVWRMLADSLRARGIRRIDGAIVADESHWDSDYVHGDWEVYDVLWWYAAPVGALGFNDNSIDFSVAPAAPGEPAAIRWQPDTKFFTFVNRSITGPAGSAASLDFTRLPGSDTIVAYGSIPADAPRRTEYFAVHDPARYAATVFMETLARSGIAVGDSTVRVARGGRFLAAPQPQSATRVLVSWQSVPLPRLIAPVLQSSQNWFAEQLLKTIAREVAGEGSWSRGLELERRFLIDVIGIDSTAFRLRDASGLSAGNLVTPDALARILLHIDRTPRMQPVLSALPVSGAPTGSLRRRLEDLNGKVVAKTGSIRNVDSLSGFLVAHSGRRVAFSIIVNGGYQPSGTMRAHIDEVVRALAQSL